MNTSAPSIAIDKEVEQRQVRSERLALLKKNRSVKIGLSILVFWFLCAIFGSFFVPYKPDALDLMSTNAPTSWSHWFGTDELGRDVFSRVIVGARPILSMAFFATTIGVFLGSAVGLALGFLKGKIDLIGMRILESISAIPLLVLALLLFAALNGGSQFTTILIIGFVFTPIVAFTVRAAVLGESELEYVTSAHLRTENTAHILFREILPNILSPIIVEFTVRLGYAVFAIATLSFLGAGVEPGSPNWGSQVADNYPQIYGQIWWSTLFPALAIATLTIGVNLLTDGLLETLDQ